MFLACLIFILCMGALSRMAGNGYGQQWNMPWLPEALFTAPFGVAFAVAVFPSIGWLATPTGLMAWGWSYVFMQSATWMFLQWETHPDPNPSRTSTLKPVIDLIATRFGYKLGDEGYAWIAAGLKGFLIGLPVGGIPLALLWPFGYEIGSHAKGRIEKYGIDPHTVSEFAAGCGAGLSILLFVWIFC